MLTHVFITQESSEDTNFGWFLSMFFSINHVQPIISGFSIPHKLDGQNLHQVGGFKHVLFSISYMGYIILPSDFYMFQDGYRTTNQPFLFDVFK